MRQVIAKRLTESKSGIPHLYLTRELKLSKLLNLRKQFKEAGQVVSVNDIVVKVHLPYFHNILFAMLVTFVSHRPLPRRSGWCPR